MGTLGGTGFLEELTRVGLCCYIYPVLLSVCFLGFVLMVKDVSAQLLVPARMLAACCRAARTIIAINPLEL